MLKPDLTLYNTAPRVEEFLKLRTKAGWENVEQASAQKSLENSLFHVTARIEDELVGMARIVGDGYMYFYVQDVVIAPEYQGRNIGTELMGEVERYLLETAKAGATIGLLAAFGKEEFYQRFGYTKRTGEPLGLGMCKFIAS